MYGGLVETALTGVVVSKRKVSKKLVFFDLESAEGTITELCIKPGLALTETQVKDIRDDVKLGDTIISRGFADPCEPKIVLLSSITVITRWRDEHSGVHFVPKCAFKASRQTESKASQVCKFHINGGCQKGDDCPHLHVDLAAAPRVRQSWIAERKQARKQAAAERGDPHSGSTAKKSARAAVLAQWLVDTYGPGFLNCGTGVVDVAGGRGSLSFALKAHHGVTCTLVDPRPPKPTKEQLRFWQQCSGSAACPQELPMQPGQGARAESRGGLLDHIQAAFDENLWSGPHAQRLRAASLIVGLHPDQATDSIVDFAVRTGKPFAVVPCCVFPRLFNHRRMPQNEAQIPRGVVDKEISWQVGQYTHDMLEQSSNGSSPSCRLLYEDLDPECTRGSQEVAMAGRPQNDLPWPEDQESHQCTDESITVQALHEVGGEAVVTHEQLLIYLQHMGGPDVCTTRLPFDGMNAIVYRLPGGM